MNYHTCGQMTKTIIDYPEEFEQAQTERQLMILNDIQCMIVGGQMEAYALTFIDYHEPFDQGLMLTVTCSNFKNSIKFIKCTNIQ